MTHASSPLDRTGAAPLYVQIREALRQQIESRSIPPGTMLPTEEELQSRYGVARSVVRQALGDLTELGLISRQRGRGSVVVPAPEHRRRAEQAGGLRQQFAATGHQLRTELVNLIPGIAPAVAADALGTEDSWLLERTRLVEDQPVVFMRTWLPRRLFSSLDAECLNGGSLHDWMRSTGVEPVGGPRQVQAVPADEIVATHLRVATGTPVLLLEGVTRDPDGQGVEWFSAWHRPHTVFDVDARTGLGGSATASSSGGMSDERLTRARDLVRDLATLLEI